MDETINGVIKYFEENKVVKRMDIIVDKHNVSCYRVGKNIRIDIDCKIDT